MSFAFSAKKVKGIKALSKDVLVIDMDMGEQKTAGGLIIQSDDGKAHARSIQYPPPNFHHSIHLPPEFSEITANCGEHYGIRGCLSRCHFRRRQG